jgi:hypothetical protein
VQKSGEARGTGYFGWATTVHDWFAAEKFAEKTTNLLKFLNVIAAVLIGFLGALAFYAGVKFGFISRETRKTLLEYLPDSDTAVRHRKHFYFMGGIVAGIFQWAQPDVLAPIQAFVLGATWPSVVTRIMSGSTNPGSTVSPQKEIEKLVETPPEKIATPSGKGATDAVVVIGGSAEPPKPPAEPPKPPAEPPKPPTEPPKPPTEPPKPPTESPNPPSGTIG